MANRERTQLNVLESLRKRLDQCRVTCRAAKDNLLLDYAAQSFNLRGNADAPEPEKSGVKVPKGGKGKLLYSSQSKRNYSQSKRKSANETLDNLGTQLIWLRRTLTDVDNLFSGRHAEIFRQDLVTMITEIENIVNGSMAGSKFPHTAKPSGVYKKAVELATKEYRKLVGVVTVSERVTKDHEGKEYLTTFLVSRDVKVGRSMTLPTHVIALSELSVENPSKRERFITQLPEVAFTFKPKYRYGRGVEDNLKDFMQVLHHVLAKDFMDKIPSSATRDVSNELTNSIPGVEFSLITKTGALQIQVKGDADLDKVTADVYRLLISEIRKTDPAFRGQISHVDTVTGGKTYVTFSAPGSKRLKDSKLLTEVLNINSAGFVKTKLSIPVTNITQQG